MFGDFIHLTIDSHAAGFADVEDADLAALAEEVRLEGFVVAECERRACRDGAADDGAVEIGVNEADLAGKKEVFEQKSGARFVRIEDRRFAG